MGPIQISHKSVTYKSFLKSFGYGRYVCGFVCRMDGCVCVCCVEYASRNYFRLLRLGNKYISCIYNFSLCYILHTFLYEF